MAIQNFSRIFEKNGPRDPETHWSIYLRFLKTLYRHSDKVVLLFRSQ